MAKAGLGFILVAILIVIVVILDSMSGRSARHGVQFERWQDENIDRQIPEEVEVLPREERDLLNFHISDEDILNAEERRLRDRREDYIYEVKPGESIDDIARKYLGHHDRKDDIYNKNPELFRGVGLRPGTRIVIPFSARR
ncbi:MAG: LysM peptidoglycan-binding domain-containing protein [Planctomycetes bacterium]|nr:LysM peptidoglycan-binding domain-containing protein [Planctomycetota bacterium]